MTDLVVVRRLDVGDLLGGLDFGRSRLNEFSEQYAAQNDARGWSATWLALVDDEPVGFVNIVPGAVQRKLILPIVSDLPEYPAPILLLARMGVDKEFRKSGVGKAGSALMRVVFQEAAALADRFGCAGIVTDAKAAGEAEESPVPVYAHYGFEVIVPNKSPDHPDSTTKMFLSMAKVRERLSVVDASASGR